MTTIFNKAAAATTTTKVYKFFSDYFTLGGCGGP
jgi:hypothetical protein